MKINYHWLQDYVPLTVSAKRLGQDLTMVGFALEALDETSYGPVLEFEVTSNRGDCLSHLGIAREAAAIYNLELQAPDCSIPVCVGSDIAYDVQIHNPELCRRYGALLLTDVRIEPSPGWLQDRLLSLGQRPVNNVVDITNYVLLELGHPLHAFDLDKLSGNKIIVRTACHEEPLKTLDGVDRKLDTSMLVIADESRPVALAGIMGGEESEISETTTRLLLESAHFNPTSVRRTARSLGISTEAAYHFERNADIENAERAIGRCARLLVENTGGRIASPLIDNYPGKQPRRTVIFNPEHVSNLMGMKVAPDFAAQRLSALGFEVQQQRKTKWKVAIPTFRQDVEMEVDLIEEVARHFGYRQIPSTHSAWRGIAQVSQWRERETLARRSLQALGYSEVVNTSFATEQELEQFSGYGGEPVELRNPISEVETRLRWNILPMLLRNCRHNFNHGNKNQRLFELGQTHSVAAGGNQVLAQRRLGILMTGLATPANWASKSRELGFFDLKGQIAALLRSLRTPNPEYRSDGGPSFFAPNLVLAIWSGERPIGYLGRLNRRIEQYYKYRQPVFVCDLDSEFILGHSESVVRYQPLPKYPPIRRDISFVIDKAVQYDTIESLVLGTGIGALQSVELSDLYPLHSGEEGKVSLTIRLTYQSRERTLTVDEANELDRQVIRLLGEKLGASLRG